MNDFNYIWMQYRKNAWGKDTFRPKSGGSDESFGGISLFLIDNLDSLFFMSSPDLFDEAKASIMGKKLPPEKKNVRTAVMLSNILGSLLSIYETSMDDDFLQKATTVGEEILAAFSYREEKFPYTYFNYDEGEGEVVQDAIELGDALTISELIRLSQLTGDDRFAQATEPIISFLE